MEFIDTMDGDVREMQQRLYMSIYSFHASMDLLYSPSIVNSMNSMIHDIDGTSMDV